MFNRESESIFNEQRFPTEKDAVAVEGLKEFVSSAVPPPAFRWATRLVDGVLKQPRRTSVLLGCLLLGAVLFAFTAESTFGLLAMTACTVIFSLLLGGVAAVLVIERGLKQGEEALWSLAAAHAERLGTPVPEVPKAPDALTGILMLDRYCALTAKLLSLPLNQCDLLAGEYRELKERYELVTTNIAASVVIYNSAGDVVLCSPYSQVLTGYSAAEIDAFLGEGRDFIESIVIEEDLERYRRARQVSRVGEDILVRYRVRHRSGLRLWLETRMVPVVDEDGDLASVMCVTIDVTDSLTYQEQIEEQNRDLSDFAYMVSHDLKAPIFTIRGMANAMLEDHGSRLGEDGMELLNYILDGAQRLEQLVASVIEYSAVATKDGNRAEVDLGQAIEDAKADLQELIRTKRAALKVQTETQPVIIGDGIRIYQVFSNLIGNALKYSSPERSPEILITIRRPDTEYVVVDIKDNGLGIPEERLDDIFRPYHRAHGNDIEGSGIGLACVKKIVERSGGSVSVRSTLGEGSVFSVSFPATAADPRAVPPDLVRLF